MFFWAKVVLGEVGLFATVKVPSDRKSSAAETVRVQSNEIEDVNESRCLRLFAVFMFANDCFAHFAVAFGDDNRTADQSVSENFEQVLVEKPNVLSASVMAKEELKGAAGQCYVLV